MADGITITVTGGEQVLRALDALAARCSSEELLGIIEQGAEIIQEAWKERVPVYTGRYRDNIHIEKLGAGSGNAQVIVTTSAVNPEDEYPYPWALEYGTATMAAQPSATPAFEESRDEAINVMRESLRNLVERRG